MFHPVSIKYLLCARHCEEFLTSRNYRYGRERAMYTLFNCHKRKIFLKEEIIFWDTQYFSNATTFFKLNIDLQFINTFEKQLVCVLYMRWRDIYPILLTHFPHHHLVQFIFSWVLCNARFPIPKKLTFHI